MSALRSLTYVIFAYTTVEGLVVNIMYPNVLPFIFKDVLIVLAYVALVSEARPASRSLSKISGPLMAFGLVTCLFLLLESPVSLLGELVAVKQRLLYIPLIWVGYYFVREEKDLQGLLKVMAFWAIPACIFGIYLYFVGPSGLMSLGANYSAVISSTSGEHRISFWRVPGTFTSPGQYGGFLLTNTVLFVGVLFDQTLESRQRILTVVALIVAIGALLVSGSRSPLLLFMLCCVVMLVITGRLRGIGVWAGGLYGILTVAFSFFGAGVQDRVGSIASFEHVTRFQNTYFGQLFWPMLMQAPMGFGLGRATIGARHFTEWSNIMLVESYFGIIVAETGVIGLATYLFAMIVVVTQLVKFHHVMKTAPSRILWYACTLPVLVAASLMPVSTGVDAAPSNLYFYFFLGVSFRIYDLEISRRQGTQDPNARPAGYPAVSYQ